MTDQFSTLVVTKAHKNTHNPHYPAAKSIFKPNNETIPKLFAGQSISKLMHHLAY